MSCNSKQLNNKQIEEAKDNAEQRWKVSKGQYKKVLASSKEVRSKLKVAENRIRYLEKLLAFEERSGFLSNKQIEAAKDNAKQRWKVARGRFKKMRNTSNSLRSKLKDSKDRIGYLEKLLAFEERSGFSALVSEMQLE